MYYTKATEPPMFKVFHYLIFFTVTLFGLIFTYTTNFSQSIYEQNISNFYSYATTSNYNNFNVNSESDFILLENEKKEDTVLFSEMTKSEIYNFQNEIKQNIKNYENNQNNYSSYVELQKQLKNSQYALDNNEYLYPYSQRDLDTVAYAIYREAGSWWLEDRHRDLVGCVVRNRKNQGGINSNLNNPSYGDIISEEGQYPYNSSDVNVEVIPDYCYESAIRVLEYKVDCPDSIIWQATFKQGSGVYEKFYDDVLGTTTYFCKK